MSTAPATLTPEIAARYAELALANIQREFPNKLDQILNRPDDVQPPGKLHPIFYGSYDWHSSVHAHWLLVHVVSRFPKLRGAAGIREVLDRHFTPERAAGELAYLQRPNSESFERPYGWAWLLKLQEALLLSNDADGQRWAAALQPLADAFAQRFLTHLPKAVYPIRYGVHSNSAFALSFALDYARTAGRGDLAETVVKKAKRWFGHDADYPAAWEPNGEDFLSPALAEADLMRRVLGPRAFLTWLDRFLPGLADSQPAVLFKPALVTQRSDPKLVHLDGLNLSRVACWRGVLTMLPASDPRRPRVEAAIAAHLKASLSHVLSGNYAGEHWLATYAVMALERRDRG